MLERSGAVSFPLGATTGETTPDPKCTDRRLYYCRLTDRFCIVPQWCHQSEPSRASEPHNSIPGRPRATTRLWCDGGLPTDVTGARAPESKARHRRRLKAEVGFLEALQTRGDNSLRLFDALACRRYRYGRSDGGKDASKRISSLPDAVGLFRRGCSVGARSFRMCTARALVKR